MTNRVDVDRLLSANRQIVRMAQNDLTRLFGSLDLTRPELARDVLLEVMPELVTEYGGLAGGVSTEWYREVRAKSKKTRRTRHRALPVPPTNPVEVQKAVRWAAGHLFTGNPEETLKLLSGALQRHVMNTSRETVRYNTQTDSARPKYARVPAGEHTCAFCMLLASRGFVYKSEENAGETGGMFNSYHDYCDCQIVPEWDFANPNIEGYDPSELYVLYKRAWSESEDQTIVGVTATMRRMYPDLVTDGVQPSL